MLVFKPHNTSRLSSYVVELVKVFLSFLGPLEKTGYILIYVNSKVLYLFYFKIKKNYFMYYLFYLLCFLFIFILK